MTKPSPQHLTFYFGKLHIIAEYEDRGEYIHKLLRSGSTEIRAQHAFGIVDVKELENHAGEVVFYAVLSKYQPEYSLEVVNRQERTIGSDKVRNVSIAKSAFFIDPKSMLIGYSSSSQISSKQFVQVFVLLLQKAQENLMIDVSIDSIANPDDVMKSINGLKRLTRITIQLSPSNPTNRNIWKKHDERLRKLKVRVYKEEYRTDSETGNIKDATSDKEIEAKIVMTTDGYGETTAEGFDADGKKKTVSTRTNQLTAQIKKSDDESEVLEQVDGVFKKIWARFQENRKENGKKSTPPEPSR